MKKLIGGSDNLGCNYEYILQGKTKDNKYNLYKKTNKLCNSSNKNLDDMINYLPIDQLYSLQKVINEKINSIPTGYDFTWDKTRLKQYYMKIFKNLQNIKEN